MPLLARQMVELEFKPSLTPELELVLLHQKPPQPAILTTLTIPVRTQSIEGQLWSGTAEQSEK